MKGERKVGKPKMIFWQCWIEEYEPIQINEYIPDVDKVYKRKMVLITEDLEKCPFCGKILGNFDTYCGYCGAKMDV